MNFHSVLVSTRKYSVLHKDNKQNSAQSNKEEEIEENNENLTHLAYVAMSTKLSYIL